MYIAHVLFLLDATRRVCDEDDDYDKGAEETPNPVREMPQVW